jgi:hypothetical protein
MNRLRLNEYVTLDGRLYNDLFKQEVVAAPVTATFFSLMTFLDENLIYIQ